MITISLDEQGHFENVAENPSEVMLVAGVLYDDNGDAEDTERERTRIKRYFQKVCAAAHGNYPEDLHNSRKEGAVKTEYTRTIADFFRNGSYKGRPVAADDGKPRSGSYYIYAIVKSKAGKKACWEVLYRILSMKIMPAIFISI